MKSKKFKTDVTRVFSLLLALLILLSLATSESFAASYKNISVTAPSSVTVTPGKATTIKIQFKGEGIGYTKAYVTSGISGTQSTQWKGYPSICTATLTIKATKAGTVTFVLGNNEDGDFKKVNIKIKLVASSTSQKYYVSHVKGVNLRSKASTSGKILTAIPYGTALTVTQVSGNWGKTTYNKKTGWVCLDYCTKKQSSASNTSSSQIKGGYDKSTALSFAKANVYTHSEDWLCAEYVARCLKAGGLNININSSKTAGGLYEQLKKTNKGTVQKLTMESNGRILYTKNKGKISQGDVIFTYCTRETDGRPFVHAVLVSDPNGSKGVKVYAHNNPKNNEIAVFNYCAFCKKAGRNAVGGTFAYVYHFN